MSEISGSSGPTQSFSGGSYDTYDIPQETQKQIGQLLKDASLILQSQQEGQPQTTTQVDPSVTGQRPALVAPDDVDPEAMVYAMMALRTASEDQQLKVSENDINSVKQKQAEQHKERMEQIEESYAKMKEAKKGGIFGKIFGWIATVALAVAAVAMIATGVGAVAGGLMLAAAGMMLANQISQETGGWLMEGLAEAIQFIANDVIGVDPPMTDEEAMMAAMITFTVTVAVLGIAGGVAAAGGGAAAGAGAASTAASSGTGAAAGGAAAGSGAAAGGAAAGAGASAGASAASATSAISQIASKIMSASQIIGGLAAVGQGSSTIYTSVKTKEAQDAQAEAMEIMAFIQQMQGVMEEEMERIKEILERMQEGSQIVMDMMMGQNDSKSFLLQQQRV